MFHHHQALENLTDFHVEYDENRPNYRKVTAVSFQYRVSRAFFIETCLTLSYKQTFKKNDTFKNETLTKEFEIDQEDGNSGKVLSKSTIDYHSGKVILNRGRCWMGLHRLIFDNI